MIPLNIIRNKQKQCQIEIFNDGSKSAMYIYCLSDILYDPVIENITIEQRRKERKG